MCVCVAKRDWRLKILLGELHWGLQLRQMQRRSNKGLLKTENEWGREYIRDVCFLRLAERFRFRIQNGWYFSGWVDT